MKSELYQIISRIAVFCMVATAGLGVLGGVLLYTLRQSDESSQTKQIVALIVLIVGLLLFAISCVVALYFRKRARIAQKGERDGE